MGISVKLPLYQDTTDGLYRLNKTIQETVQQNLKMLILTAPGERIMDALYGVGLRNYLFENAVETSYSDIVTKIREQVAKYMPFLEILDIRVNNLNDFKVVDNFINVKIIYNIAPLNEEDILSLNVNNIV